jgi:hypothetical protein
VNTTSKVYAWLISAGVTIAIGGCAAQMPTAVAANATAPGSRSHVTFDTAQAPEECAMPAACCKVCHKGKACGNSCIARNKDCHQPPGCACDG